MNLDALRNHKFASITAPYTDKEVMLYALSLGVCNDPLDRKELPFVYEKNLVALPSMTAVLAYPGPWITNPAFDVNFVKLLHGEQRTRFYKPLPPTGDIRGEFTVQSVADKARARWSISTSFFTTKPAAIIWQQSLLGCSSAVTVAVAVLGTLRQTCHLPRIAPLTLSTKFKPVIALRSCTA